MMEKEFLKKYFEMAAATLIPGSEVVDDLIQVKQALEETQRSGKKIMIAGNGGSAAIANHFSVDLTKNAGVRCVNFNDAGLVTCFANDYGYERWVEKAVYFYGESGDIFIAISSSGRSKNILNGCKAARQKGCTKIVTLSGFDPDNPLRLSGDINLWVPSRAYNIVETVHQLWLLAVVDLVIGKAEYSADRETVLLGGKK